MAGLIDSLIPLLEKDAQHLDLLEIALKDERVSLETRNNEQLQVAVERKAQNLQLLEQNARDKTQLFHKHGLKPSPQHIRNALKKIGREDVLGLWEKVASHLESCKRMNEVNGRIVFRSQQSLHRVMTILRGQSHQEKLYTPQGRDNGLGPRNLIANA